MRPTPPARWPAWIAGLCLCTLAGHALAAPPVWRCGPDGRVFSDRPCSDGSVYAVSDTRSSDEIQAAQALAEREQRLARSLAAEREERHAQAVGSGLSGIGPLQAEREARERAREVKRQKAQRQRAPARRWSGAGT